MALQGLGTAEDRNYTTLRLGSGVCRFVCMIAAKATRVPGDGNGANGQVEAREKDARLFKRPENIVFSDITTALLQSNSLQQCSLPILGHFFIPSPCLILKNDIIFKTVNFRKLMLQLCVSWVRIKSLVSRSPQSHILFFHSSGLKTAFDAPKIRGPVFRATIMPRNLA